MQAARNFFVSLDLDIVRLFANIVFVRHILFYKTEAGRSPVDEFLENLDHKQALKVFWVLRLMKELDLVPVQYFQKMKGTDDLWEVRVQAGNNIFRLLGFFQGRDCVVLTNGFAKKDQKTPKLEIDLAKQRKRDYLARCQP
jgi:phage-related protein